MFQSGDSSQIFMAAGAEKIFGFNEADRYAEDGRRPGPVLIRYNKFRLYQ